MSNTRRTLAALIFSTTFIFQTNAFAVAEHKPVSINSLPPRLLPSVFNHLDRNSFNLTRQVSKKWKAQSMGDEVAQRTLFSETFRSRDPHPSVESTIFHSKISPDNQLILNKGSGVLSIFQARTGQHLQTFFGDSPSFSYDSRTVLMNTFDESQQLEGISAFDCYTGARVFHLPLEGLSERDRRLVGRGDFIPTPDGKGILILKVDGLSYLEFESSKVIPLLDPDQFDGISLRSVEFILDNRFVILNRSFSRDSRAEIIDLQNFKRHHRFRGNAQYLRGRKQLLISDFSWAELRDAESGEKLMEIPAGRQHIPHPDGHKILIENRDGYGLWNLDQRQFQFQLPPSRYSFFSPDGRNIASISEDGKRVTIYDSETGLATATVAENINTLHGSEVIQFSPDSSLLAFTTETKVAETGFWSFFGGTEYRWHKEVVLWDFRNRKVKRLPFPVVDQDYKAWVSTVRFSSDSRKLLVSFGGTGISYLWNLFQL